MGAVIKVMAEGMAGMAEARITDAEASIRSCAR